MHERHCPTTGKIRALGQERQFLSEEHVLQEEEQSLHDLEALSKKKPSLQVETHLPAPERTNSSAQTVHLIGFYAHDLHDLSQATQIPLKA